MFLDFLDGPARRADVLYIVGDLFEAWIGDDAPGELGRRVARHLAGLAASGTALFFICGNRDFLVGDRFCRHASMSRLEEPRLVPAPDGPTLLLHGDTLCTDDTAYQKFRRKARDPRWQNRMLAKPVWLRALMAKLARWRSRRHTGSTDTGIMDVNSTAVETAFREHGIRRMIHGHTHRQAIHDLSIDQRHCQRIVLGDWHRSGSVLRIAGDTIAMLNVTRDDRGEITLCLHETAAPLAGDGGNQENHEPCP